MGDVVDIWINQPHVVCELMCVKCLKRWISVRPVSLWLAHIECPYCKAKGTVIMTGQPIDF